MEVGTILGSVQQFIKFYYYYSYYYYIPDNISTTVKIMNGR